MLCGYFYIQGSMECEKSEYTEMRKLNKEIPLLWNIKVHCG